MRRTATDALRRALHALAVAGLLVSSAALAHGEAFADPAEIVGVWQRYGQGQAGVWEAIELASGNVATLHTALPAAPGETATAGETLDAFWEVRPDGLIELSTDERLLLLDAHESVQTYLVLSLRAGARWRSADEIFANGVFERLEGEALERWRAERAADAP